jgi:hypothetical protein
MSSKGRLLAKERARQIAVEQRRAQERRRRMSIAGGAVGALILVLAILVGVRLASQGGPAQAEAAIPLSPAVAAAVTAVPAAVLDQVGVGQVDTLPRATTGQAMLMAGGKPLVVYVGAEYCPFCAAQRWAVVVALSRFGTFNHLGQTHSATRDAYPNTASLSFHGATYTSQYLALQAVETESNQPSGGGYAPLDTLSAQQRQILSTYDYPPFVPSSSAGSIPFLDIANQAVITGASFSPQLLAGRSADQIAAALATPSDPIAQAVGGAANAFTALLCRQTGQQPSSVCGSAAVTAYRGKV